MLLNADELLHLFFYIFVQVIRGSKLNYQLINRVENLKFLLQKTDPAAE